FFSSRRRHTRFKCDWSSDVCSSDLLQGFEGLGSEHFVAAASTRTARGRHDAMPYVGSPVRRREDRALLTGAGRFVDDIGLPRMLHLAVVRSTHAHARLGRIDTKDATALPGVAAVFTAADLPPPGPGIPPVPIVPGLDTVAPGDPDAAFRSAAVVVEAVLEQPRLAAVPLECRGIVAAYDPRADRIEVWLSTQTPHGARDLIAEILEIPRDRVRVVAPDVG